MILLVVLIGGVPQGVRANCLVITSPDDPFYLDTLNLVNVALLIGVVLATVGVLVNTADTFATGRHSLASLAAAGTPRAVLRRSLLLESLLPLTPVTVLAVAAGLLATRRILGTSARRSHGTVGREVFEMVPIAVPWIELSLLVLGTLAATNGDGVHCTGLRTTQHRPA